MNTTAGSLITVVVLFVVMVWFDARCLTDLGRTRDEDLYYLNRWALVIVVTFPIGPRPDQALPKPLWLAFFQGTPGLGDSSQRSAVSRT